MSAPDYRLGIDVGGTNTDAVSLDCSHQVRAKVTAPTTADVTSGIIAALDAVVRSTGMNASRITHAMLGPTHVTNAVLDRRKLLRGGGRTDRRARHARVRPMFGGQPTWPRRCRRAR